MKFRVIWPAILVLMAACSAAGSPGSQSAESKQKTFSAATNSAQSAAININVPFEKAFVSALDTTDQLIDAEVEYIGDMTFADTGAQRRTMTLSEDTKNLAYTGDRPLRWNVRLNPEVALDLSVTTASGELSLDATQLTLSKLALNVASGRLDADLASGKIPLNVEAKLSSGMLTVNLPESAAVNLIRADIGSGTFNLNIGAADDVSVAGVTVASGTLVIDVPDDAAVHLEVTSVASGMVNLNFGLARLSGSDPDEGVWETGGFADAAHQIHIVIDSVASGTFELR